MCTHRGLDGFKCVYIVALVVVKESKRTCILCYTGHKFCKIWLKVHIWAQVFISKFGIYMCKSTVFTKDILWL